MGRKELTGFSENTARSQGPSGPRDAPTPHTHYQQRSAHCSLFLYMRTIGETTYLPLIDKGLYFTVILCRFGNPNPLGSAREGHTGGGVQQALSNGFTKSTQVHRFGANVDTARILRHTHPYVARSVTMDSVRETFLHSTVLSPYSFSPLLLCRSIMKRNPYYDDHTHDTKLHTLVL